MLSVADAINRVTAGDANDMAVADALILDQSSFAQFRVGLLSQFVVARGPRGVCMIAPKLAAQNTGLGSGVRYSPIIEIRNSSNSHGSIMNVEPLILE